MIERRSTYFAFQGLLMAVLLLLFLYQSRSIESWAPRFSFLVAVFSASLLYLQAAADEVLSRWWFQAGLFLSDAFLASLSLHWTHPASDLYLIYFLIIFGTALARNLVQSMIVAAVTSVLYLLSAWHPVSGFPNDTTFWLRFLFLWTTASLLAILSRDSEQAQAEEKRQYQDRLIQAERLAALGRVAGEVAHRIKGPLTTIMVNAEVLAHRHGRSRELVRELGEIKEEAARCKEILKGLLDLGRIEEMDFAPLDLREPVTLALKSLDTQLRKHGIRKELSGLEVPLMVFGDQSLLQEAVTAVLQNAVEAARQGGTIRVAVQERQSGFFRRRSPDDGVSWVLVVEDDGEGMSPQDLARVFEPFFTTKGGEGSGLGLSAASRILQKHKGSIEAYSEGKGKGARFTLTIPKALAQCSETRPC